MPIDRLGFIVYNEEVYAGHRPKAKEGILELNHLEIENNVIKLDGEWEFYWNELIDPNDIDSDSMNGYISLLHLRIKN